MKFLSHSNLKAPTLSWSINNVTRNYPVPLINILHTQQCLCLNYCQNNFAHLITRSYIHILCYKYIEYLLCPSTEDWSPTPTTTAIFWSHWGCHCCYSFSEYPLLTCLWCHRHVSSVHHKRWPMMKSLKTNSAVVN